jgi:hypothetical protein
MLAVGTRATACAIASVLIAAIAPAQAELVADFYRGKSVRMLIGYGPGGGYDIYGRLVAEFLPRHLPGNPIIVPQNMPGAGSFVAAKYMAEVAPKDGTVLGSLSQMLALDSMIGNTAKADISKFAYLGRVVTNVDAGLTLLKSGIKSFENTRKKEYTVGASGGGSTSVMYPTALNVFAGSRFKIVKGYSGTADIQLAMERGEVDILPAYGLPGILATKKPYSSIRPRSNATVSYRMCRRYRNWPSRKRVIRHCMQSRARQKSDALSSQRQEYRRKGSTPCVQRFKTCSMTLPSWLPLKSGT